MQMPEWTSTSANQGDDIAGIVHAVGSRVTEFKPGDRVAAFHQIGTSGGSYAEYAVAWDHTTFHIPDQTSFEGILRPKRSTPRSPSSYLQTVPIMKALCH